MTPRGPSRALLAAAFALAGCGPSAPKGTDYEVHVYNSTGQALTIETPGQILTADQKKRLSAAEQSEIADPRRVGLGPNEATRVSILQVRPFEIKVVEPASRAGLSHKFTDLQPNVRKNLLLDLGARGSFHLKPVFYRRLQNSSKPIPPEFVAQHPPTALSGPRALYELDARYAGINVEPGPRASNPGNNDFAVVYMLVDHAGLKRGPR